MYFKTKLLNSWVIDKYFKEKDLISIEEIICKLEELDADCEHIKEQFEDFKQDVEDNFKRKEGV